MTKLVNVGVPMRDGITLRADVYRPAARGLVPVIVMRTPYDKSAPQGYQRPDWFASHCYMVVVEDIRGVYASPGVYYEFGNDQNDGYDTVEWAARLPGSNGKVGMYGSSYVGATQWLAAETAPPHLVTIVPVNTAADYFGWAYEDGAFRLNLAITSGDRATVAAQQRGDLATMDLLNRLNQDSGRWLRFTPYDRLPLKLPDNPGGATWFFDWLRHRSDDPYWRVWAPDQYYPKIHIPVLDVEGWYDAFLAGGVANFTGMVSAAGSGFARENQRLVIGPWDHVGWARPADRGRTERIEAPLLQAIGPVADAPVNQLQLAWFDHYLKGVDNGVGAGGPRVDYFQMGSNTWHTTTTWPPPGTRPTAYYLSGGGHANTAAGDGTLALAAPGPNSAADHYRYDPANPVPSLGGHSCCQVTEPGASQGPYDQREVEKRPDVLSYTSAPLADDTDVTGPIILSLYAVSSAPDTDWTAKLVVVHPDGMAVNLNNGIQRASYRDSLSQPHPITPGQVYRYTITIWPTSYLFHAGDRIRLEVSSSDFPQFDQNPNTGDWLGDSTRTQPANQTVLHDAAHPSQLLLPIVPAGSEPAQLPAAPTH